MYETTAQDRTQALRYFKQWSNEDRAQAATHYDRISPDAISFWKNSVVLWKGGTRVFHMDAGRLTFLGEYAPANAVEIPEGYGPGWTSVPLSLGRDGARSKSTPVAAVVVCANPACYQQWLAHAGDCEE